MFTRRMAPAIAEFASSRGLVAVAGSNNHGWGRTAAAWTVLRIPGWRAMSPDSLDRAIRSTLLHQPGAVRVVARASVPPARSTLGLLATPALVVWGVATRLSTAERAAWLLWAWSGAVLALFLTGRGGAAGRRGEVLLFTPSLPNVGTPRNRARRRAGGRGSP
jgi:hypothetical protein